MSSHSINLKLLFVRLPIRWEAKEVSGRQIFVPVRIGKSGQRRAMAIEDAADLSREFMRMEHSEKAGLQFLNKVGAWKVTKRDSLNRADRDITLDGAFGYRRVFGVVNRMSLEDLWAEREYWKGLMASEAKRRAALGCPSNTLQTWETEASNTLEVHLAWHSERSYAVIQPITGHELMVATTWEAVVSGAKFQVCQRPDCGQRFFSQHKREYCPGRTCAHVMAQRWYKERETARRGTRPGGPLRRP